MKSLPGDSPNDSTPHVLQHPSYRRALQAVSEHRIAKASGDTFEAQRHLRIARLKVLRDLRERLP